MNDRRLEEKLNELEDDHRVLEWRILKSNDLKNGCLIIREAYQDDEAEPVSKTIVQYDENHANTLLFANSNVLTTEQMIAICRFAKTPNKDKWFEYKPFELTEDEARLLARNDIENDGATGEFYQVKNILVSKARKSLGGDY